MKPKKMAEIRVQAILFTPYEKNDNHQASGHASGFVEFSCQFCQDFAVKHSFSLFNKRFASGLVTFVPDYVEEPLPGLN